MRFVDMIKAKQPFYTVVFRESSREMEQMNSDSGAYLSVWMDKEMMDCPMKTSCK